MIEARASMSANVNRIRNPDFSQGEQEPRCWVWSTTVKGARWSRGSLGGPAGTEGIKITSKRLRGAALWSQTVASKPGQFYRVEATVTCSLTVPNERTTPEAAGFVLMVEPTVGKRPAGERRVTPGLHRASRPVEVRTYFEAPEDSRRLKLSVGVVDARGTARVHHVRLIEILEPEEESHILALPAPSHTIPPQRPARCACICSARVAERPIGQVLAGYFGESNVVTAAPEKLRTLKQRADALLLPDPTAPPSISALAELIELAADRIVVISLPAFAQLAKAGLSVRCVEQEDDPIHAKVSFANSATRGFALDDVFPYAWRGSQQNCFVQNHFRKTKALKAFCEKYNFVTLLESVCDQDITSDRPICLYMETPRGGLFVLDIEPAEAEASTFNEPALAMHLLLSVLGQTQNGLGQYMVPAQTEAEFRESIRDMGDRSEMFVVHDAGLPSDEITEQLVTIGREDQSFGLPIKPKPVILVRTGLSSGDAESVYGAFVWFKQLVRVGPYHFPYTQQLAGQFRLAWVPLVAPWEARGGWRRSLHSSPDRTGITADCGQIAVLIDVVSCLGNEVGVVLPSHEGVYQRYAEWLPQMAAAFAPGGAFLPTVDDRETSCDRDRIAWRHLRHDPQVIVDPEAFQTEVHRSVMAVGGQVVRIEIPGQDADFCAQSIRCTDLVATLLEHVIGLQYGLIAVNRQPVTVHFDRFPPLGPGETLIIDRRDPMLRTDASQAG